MFALDAAGHRMTPERVSQPVRRGPGEGLGILVHALLAHQLLGPFERFADDPVDHLVRQCLAGRGTVTQGTPPCCLLVAILGPSLPSTKRPDQPDPIQPLLLTGNPVGQSPATKVAI